MFPPESAVPHCTSDYSNYSNCCDGGDADDGGYGAVVMAAVVMMVMIVVEAEMMVLTAIETNTWNGHVTASSSWLRWLPVGAIGEYYPTTPASV